MSDETTPPGPEGLAPEGGRAPGEAPSDAPGASVTPSGYSYEVVGGAPPAGEAAAPPRRSGLPLWSAIPIALAAALIAGVAVWFIAGRGDDGGGSSDASVTNLLNAFTSGTDGTTTRRFEGAAPPGYPDDLPAYEGERIAGSVVQVTGEDAGFIVVGDADEGRDAVVEAMRARFEEDPWQLDGAQDGRDSTLFQFSRIDDANTTGIVLITGSKDDGRTTIITSVQITGGAAELDVEPFTPAAGRSTPTDFPSEIPVYEGAVVIESAFRVDAGSKSFRVSYITTAAADDVLDFYREGLEGNDLTVEDADASSPLEDAQAIRFSDADLKLNGDVTVGPFAEDDGFTRIDVQAGDER